jgi:hypothetical protein
MPGERDIWVHLINLMHYIMLDIRSRTWCTSCTQAWSVPGVRCMMYDMCFISHHIIACLLHGIRWRTCTSSTRAWSAPPAAWAPTPPPPPPPPRSSEGLVPQLCCLCRSSSEPRFCSCSIMSSMRPRNHVLNDHGLTRQRLDAKASSLTLCCHSKVSVDSNMSSVTLWCALKRLGPH